MKVDVAKTSDFLQKLSIPSDAKETLFVLIEVNDSTTSAILTAS